MMSNGSIDNELIDKINTLDKLFSYLITVMRKNEIQRTLLYMGKFEKNNLAADVNNLTDGSITDNVNDYDVNQSVDSQLNKDNNNNSNGNSNSNSNSNSNNVNDIDSLSLRKISNNFQELSTRISKFINIFNEISRIVNWESDEKTLCVLLLYTWGCIYQHLWLVYSLIYLNYKLSMNYIKKHPIIEKPSNATNNLLFEKYWDEGLGTRLKYTKSENYNTDFIFGFLIPEENDNHAKESSANRNITQYNQSKDLSTVERYIEVVSSYLEFDKDGKIKLKQRELDESNINDFENISKFIETKRNSTTHKKTKDESNSNSNSNSNSYNNFILKNLFEIQLQSNKLLNLINSTEKFYTIHFNFDNEKSSTILLYKISTICIILFCLGSYIPWKVIFILGIWIGMLINHPYRKIIMKDLMNMIEDKKNGSKNSVKKENKVDGKQEKRTNFRDNIIIDEPAFIREVEIFEISKQNVLNLDEYEFYGFSTSIFNLSDEIRMKRRKPNLVYDLNEVLAPNLFELITNGTRNTSNSNNINNNINNNVNDDINDDNVMEDNNNIRLSLNMGVEINNKTARENAMATEKDNNNNNHNHNNNNTIKNNEIKKWDFINGEQWEINKDTQWVYDYGYDYEMFIKDNENEGWVYDITGQFRRRRYTRNVKLYKY